MRRWIAYSFCAGVVAGSAGCDGSAADRVLEIRATGTVVGLAYVDRNGNGTLDPTSEGGVAGIAARLVPLGGGGTVASGVSAANGRITFAAVPVGEYEIRIDGGVPDSLQFVKVDSTRIRLQAGDSVGVLVAFTFPSATVGAARALSNGKRVFVEGVTQNAWAAFGDSTLHVADSTGTIRAIRIPQINVVAGQRVRVLGTIARQDGQVYLNDALVMAIIGPGTAPAAVSVSTDVAARADGGRLDAALVRISNAVIVGAVTNAANDLVLSVNDGSGVLEVNIDRQTGIATTGLVPGSTLTATGLLIPSATPGVWLLKPRTGADISVSFVTLTVAEARQQQAGRVVSIDATALNSWFVFADSTVHIADATGAIRAVRVAPVNMFAGDRVRMLGTITFRDGQPTLTNVTGSVIGAGVVPLPLTLTTAAAATADAGRADAALVKVIAAQITASSTVSGDLVLTVNDGTGPLEVVLDRDVGFVLAPFVVGATLDITGVLQVRATGVDWRLKPRQQSDIVVR